ncbi:MAG: adenylate/guanylate cyclase domain-containing protein [Coriobacteriia bacterium]|nr:adenylate/guanylate cyclase domain-containing protein [Coriobacteriia bacterium]
MAQRVARKNSRFLRWAAAFGLAGATLAALLGTQFQPLWGVVALALAAGLLTLAAADLGVLTLVIAVSLPLTAANPIVGIIFLTVGVVSIRYLGADGGRAALLIATGVIGAFAGPVWVVPAIAGCVLGASEGALAAGIACVAAQVIGLMLGRERLFGLVTGGSEATQLLDFARENLPQSYFGVAWLKDSFAGLDNAAIDRFSEAFGAAALPAMLALQPVLWAAGAVAAGVIAKTARHRRSPLLSATAGAAGVAVPAVGSLLVLGPAAGLSAIALPLASSLFLAVGFAWAWDRYFPLEVVAQAHSAAGGPTTMAAEDADVDELLRLISTAEDKLATDHTTQKTVMITDMKAFSRMTEEDGSILTAKAIQRHRDLLLPIIERHGGHGKSTGGDGLVAAFAEPAGALRSAVEMQRTLDAHNASHPGEREMTVRIGVADGEVVLDKGGRPFIGAALNLAARVMNLADGGQAYATAEVASKAAGAVDTRPLGEFELKNIAKPVQVSEILWRQESAD